MSERDEEAGEESGGTGSAFGPFLLGVSLGAVLGFLFAPEPGAAARGRLSRRLRGLRGLRGLAAEKAGELAQLLDTPEAAERDVPPATARAALERRLAEAKQRRRGPASRRAALPRPTARDEEDEPVA
jgi:hypothetical protein